jgi:chromosome partitioning protein
MGKIIACVNEKGGVAKTTTIKNLAVGLAEEGKKVLAIDLDPSANLTTSLGVFLEPGADSILNILRKSDNFDNIPEGYAIIKHNEGIDLIPSVPELHSYEKELSQTQMSETVLRRYLLEMKDKYDYILIDCPAGLGIFVTNALFAADSVLIPVQPQFLGTGAMQNLFSFIGKVRKLNGTGTKPEISGVLFTLVRPSTNNDKDMMRYYRESYDGKIYVYDTYISQSIKISESDGEGQSIYKYSPKTAAAFTYRDFVKEFLERENKAC